MLIYWQEMITCGSLLFKVVVREVGRLRPISEYLFPAAESLLAESEPAPEKEAFESRVLATRTLWDGVQVRSDNRHVIIERVFPLAQNYDDAFRVLNVWLRDTEQKVINLAPVPCDTVSLDSQQRTLSVSVSIDGRRTLDTLSLHPLLVIWKCINANSQSRILVDFWLLYMLLYLWVTGCRHKI